MAVVSNQARRSASNRVRSEAIRKLLERVGPPFTCRQADEQTMSILESAWYIPLVGERLDVRTEGALE
jgi:hypothetical protein